MRNLRREGVTLRAPFPWFGGKAKVAPDVWTALGDPGLYVEPFAGSLAVLLGRPRSKQTREVVNDLDGYLSNFWRAVASDPEAVAHWADWPVNEIDLFARHSWLVNAGDGRLRDGLRGDPDFYDVKVAGWWVWGLCSWIGSGWCSGDGAWVAEDGTVRKKSDDAPGVQDQRPQITSRPGINAARGVVDKRPHLSHPQGITATRSANLAGYFAALSERLRDVVVCSGDWARVVTDGALSASSTVGVFLDPPYSGDVRERDLYSAEGYDIAVEVRDWAVAHGDDPRLRIVLAGYETEHEDVVPKTWRRVRWSARSSYATAASARRKDGNHANRHLETLWCSPGCLQGAQGSFEMF